MGHRVLSVLVTAVLVGVALVVAPAGSGAADATSPGAVGGLTTEALTDPIGIDAAAPRFGWLLKDPKRGATQRAYQILVASSAAELGRGTGNVWDSGKVSSADSTQVPYGGPALVSSTRYYWKVRIWGVDGDATPWSSPDYFETGLLAPQNWTGSRWITVDGLNRKTFTLPGAPTWARLYISARGNYEEPAGGGVCCSESFGLARGVYLASLNGTHIGDKEYDPAPVDTTKRALYSTYDVTDMLHQGTNVLAAQLAETSQIRGVLLVRLGDGSTVKITTDPSWVTHTGPVTAANRYNGEHYDARLAIPGWDTPGYDASGWAPVSSSGYAVHPGNLAQGKTVTTLDTTSCCGWQPSNLVDGVLTSTATSEGYHSALGTSADEAKWAQVDLGSSAAVNTVVLYPAHPTNFSPDTPGFGFPVRYKIDVSDDPTFATGVSTVVDKTAADQPNPGDTPQRFDFTAARGRYVRVTATKLYLINGDNTGNGNYNFALAEMTVNPFSGVAASDELGSPGWDPRFLADGITQSQAGAEGYASATTTNVDDTKWVQLDLGSSQSLGSVDLYPAATAKDGAGYGFPVRYKIQVSDDPTFATGVTTVVDKTGADQPNPGSAVQSFTFGQVSGQYVRLTATRLYEQSDGSHLLALAEMVVGPSASGDGMRAEVFPPMRVIRTVTPVKVTKLGDGHYVMDYGQNITGVTQLTVQGAAGTTVTIKHGELLDKDGHASTGNVVAQQTDQYTLDGHGTEVWRAGFVYHGFRYAEVTGYPGTLFTAADLVALEIHSDVSSTGSFNSSNTLLNQINEAIRQTQVNNLHGVPEDCPTREKRGWMADAHLSAEEAIDNFGMQAFYENFVQNMADEQTASGLVPDFVPTEPGFENVSDTAWGAATVLTPWYLYQRYGDLQILQQHYDMMRKWVDYVGTTATDYIVDHPSQAWGEDWLGVETTPGPLFRSGYYYLGAHLVAQAAALLGKNSEATAYAALGQNIADALNKRYLHPAALTSNLAEGQPVTYSDSYEGGGWSAPNLVDGVTTAVAGNYGFDSQVFADPNTTHWVQVDLGASKQVHEIDLYPPGPNFLGTPGYGFPVRYKLEVSNDPTFATGVTTVVDKTGADQANPGDGVQKFTFDPASGRYVRLTVTKLFTNNLAGNNVFALAELEVNPGEGRPVPAYYGNDSQFSNAFPLYLGIVPAADQSAVAQSLVNDLAARDGHFAGGIHGAKYTAEALMKLGRSDLVFQAVTKTGSPSWAYMIAQGPGTIWESWDGGGSRDHPALGSIGSWFYEGLAGLQTDPSGPGYKKSVIDPGVPDGLDSASGSIQTPYGGLASSWTRDGDTLTLTVTVPANTTATVVVPTLGQHDPKITERGTTVWSGGAGNEGDHVTPAGPQGDGVAFHVASGHYTFTVSP